MRAIRSLEQMGYRFALNGDVLNYTHNGGLSDPDRACALLGYVRRHRAEAMRFFQERSRIEAQLDDHLALMAAATGCSDETAEELLAEYDRLMAFYALSADGPTGVSTETLENLRSREEALAPAPKRRSGDPPPAAACSVSENHRRWWQRPLNWGGGWVCAICHPAPPGLDAEMWEIPIETML